MRVSCGALPVIVACGLFASAASARVITNIAGTDFSFPTSTLAALNAPPGFVSAVAVDTAGNVFVADYNNLVGQISVDGNLSVVAGNGGPSTSASLAHPGGVAVDRVGNLYIADYFNQRIRKVSGGTITTVAGNGVGGFSGDGGPATSASLNLPHPGSPGGSPVFRRPARAWRRFSVTVTGERRQACYRRAERRYNCDRRKFESSTWFGILGDSHQWQFMAVGCPAERQHAGADYSDR